MCVCVFEVVPASYVEELFRNRYHDDEPSLTLSHVIKATAARLVQRVLSSARGKPSSARTRAPSVPANAGWLALAHLGTHPA